MTHIHEAVKITVVGDAYPNQTLKSNAKVKRKEINESGIRAFVSLHLVDIVEYLQKSYQYHLDLCHRQAS